MADPNINIKASKFILGGSIEAYLQKKVQTLEKFLHEENELRVEFKQEPPHHTGPHFKVEMEIGPNSKFFAEAYGNDLHEAVDLVIPKIKEQLRKQKDKNLSKKLHEERRKRE